MKSAEDLAANALARAQIAAAGSNPETMFNRGFEGGKAFEREAIARMIEAMIVPESGPDYSMASDKTRADTRSYNRIVRALAERVRNRSEAA